MGLVIVNLREVINRISAIEETIEVTDPRFPMKIAKVYPYWADADEAVELPCVFHSWAFVSERRLPNEQRQIRWAVRSQMLIAPAAAERALNSELATAFAEAYIDAFDRHVQLQNLTGTIQNLRPNDGVWQPGILTWGSTPYVGLDWVMDVLTLDVTTIGG